MPAVSKQQQKFMGIVRAIQKGDAKASDFSKDAQKVAKNMKPSDVRKYAATKHKGLPSKRETLEKRLEELIKKIDEKWSDKYKKSIDCNNPKGFSQKAHCAGRKKRNEIMDNKNLNKLIDEEISALFQKTENFRKNMSIIQPILSTLTIEKATELIIVLLNNVTPDQVYDALVDANIEHPDLLGLDPEHEKIQKLK